MGVQNYKRAAVAKLPSFGKMETDSSILVGVAQLVERWIVAPVAEGSNPFAHPLYLNDK
jgi:hypothetical protein